MSGVAAQARTQLQQLRQTDLEFLSYVCDDRLQTDCFADVALQNCKPVSMVLQMIQTPVHADISKNSIACFLFLCCLHLKDLQTSQGLNMKRTDTCCETALDKQTKRKASEQSELSQ